MPDVITSREYPKCSRLGVLRRAQSRTQAEGRLVVSTGALHDRLGWKTYQAYLPLMRYECNTGPTPESCEAFLRGLNGY
jgi:hypothetical protein